MPTPRSIRTVLVANRGEIAVRVVRTLRDLGIRSVAVFSDADRDALHVRAADEAHWIGGDLPADSYLRVDRVLAAARASGADAVHPGYGFLAENADFARACAAAGLTWIGPPPDAIERMGTKTGARAIMQAAGVPVVPGTVDPVDDLAAATAAAAEVGYPVAVKARSGGGGRGFRVAHGPDELAAAFAGASGEGARYFSDAAVYLERYLHEPRHVEVQLLADEHGTVVHLGERDCSVQRRHQKLVEETPSPAVTPAVRARLAEIAVGAARAVGYTSAGTVECLLDASGEPFFLEMNTRVQVEHTVSEQVTGIDVVAEQLRIAAGEPLGYGQDDVGFRGWAMECRINAEDAARDFAPGSGLVTRWVEPSGPFVRVDAGVRAGSDVPPFYDSLLAKLVTWGPDRETARRRMLRALDEFEIGGVDSLLPFHRALLAHPDFVAGGTCAALTADPAGALGLAAQTGRGPVGAPVDAVPGVPRTPPRVRRMRDGLAGAAGSGEVLAPIPGTVVRVDVAVGEVVGAGQALCTLEAMKMENEVVAPVAGTVEVVAVSAGDQVPAGTLLVRVTPADLPAG